MPVPVAGMHPGRQIILVGPVIQHLFDVILDARRQVLGHFLRVAHQIPHFRVVHQRIGPVFVVGGLIVAYLRIGDPDAKLSPNAGAIHIQIRKGRLACGGLSGRTFPEPAVAVQGQLVIIDIFIKTCGHLIIPEPVIGPVGMHIRIASGPTA